MNSEQEEAKKAMEDGGLDACVEMITGDELSDMMNWVFHDGMYSMHDFLCQFIEMFCEATGKKELEVAETIQMIKTSKKALGAKMRLMKEGVDFSEINKDEEAFSTLMNKFLDEVNKEK